MTRYLQSDQRLAIRVQTLIVLQLTILAGSSTLGLSGQSESSWTVLSLGTVLLWIIFRADLRAVTGTPWSYVKVPQMEFADLQPEKNLSELFLAFG